MFHFALYLASHLASLIPSRRSCRISFPSSVFRHLLNFSSLLLHRSSRNSLLVLFSFFRCFSRDKIRTRAMVALQTLGDGCARLPPKTHHQRNKRDIKSPHARAPPCSVSLSRTILEKFRQSTCKSDEKYFPILFPKISSINVSGFGMADRHTHQKCRRPTFRFAISWSWESRAREMPLYEPRHEHSRCVQGCAPAETESAEPCTTKHGKVWWKC